MQPYKKILRKTYRTLIGVAFLKLMMFLIHKSISKFVCHHMRALSIRARPPSHHPPEQAALASHSQSAQHSLHFSLQTVTPSLVVVLPQPQLHLTSPSFYWKLHSLDSQPFHPCLSSHFP